MISSKWGEQRKKFQKLIRELRKESGLTQLELATLLEKPQSYVSKYESGERRLDLIEVRDICSKLNLSLEEFSHRFEELLNASSIHVRRK